MAAIAGGAAILLAAIVWWRGAPGPARSTLPEDTMDLDQAWAAARRNDEAGRYTEAVRDYRRAARLAGGAWEIRHNLASALRNSALEVRSHLGRLDPALRSAFERQRAMREAFRELDRGEALATGPAARAFSIRERGRAYHTWGLALDALREADRAASVITVAQNDSLRNQILAGMVTR